MKSNYHSLKNRVTMSIAMLLHPVILLVFAESFSIKVVHQIPKSELLDVVERSWVENGVLIENKDSGMLLYFLAMHTHTYERHFGKFQKSLITLPVNEILCALL